MFSSERLQLFLSDKNILQGIMRLNSSSPLVLNIFPMHSNIPENLVTPQSSNFFVFGLTGSSAMKSRVCPYLHSLIRM